MTSENRTGRIAKPANAGQALPPSLVFHDRLAEAITEAGRLGNLLHLLAARAPVKGLRENDLSHWSERDEAWFTLLSPARQARAKPELAGLNLARLNNLSSFGIAQMVSPGVLPERLRSDALGALVAAEETRRDQILVDSKLEPAGPAPMDLQDLDLHFQPQLRLADHRFSGVEALIRRKGPGATWTTPGQLQQWCHDKGQAEELGLWVLGRALRQIRDWHDQGHRCVTMAINLSPVQIMDEGSLERLLAAVDQNGLSSGSLELEVTEHVPVDDPDRLADRLTVLAESGFRLALDDFGTGFATLGLAQRLPLHRVKLAAPLSQRLCAGDKHDHGQLAQLIAHLNGLGLDVVAEGVENDLMLDKLMRAGCDYLQGYHLGPPMPPEALAAVLTAQDR